MKSRPERDPRLAIDVRISWPVYFRAFCEEHGEPEEWDGRLWFRDGWAYSASNHAGPEWEPPKDKVALKAIQVRYWTQRREAAVKEFARIERDVENILDRVKARPGLIRPVTVNGKEVTALSHVQPWVGEVAVEGVTRTVRGSKRFPVVGIDDLASHLRGPLANVRRVIEECDRELKELNNGKEESKEPELGSRQGVRAPR